MKRFIVVVLTIVCISGIYAPVLADSVDRRPPDQETGFNDIPVIIDVLILRPVGLATCVLGMAASIVAMPFALPSDSTKQVYQLLIADPFYYTFKRPIGKSK
jgi:hypothetical protein